MTSIETRELLDDAARITFANLADVLIPAGGGLPSASRAGAHNQWLDHVLKLRPDLQEPLSTVLNQAVGCDAKEIIAELKIHRPELFDVLAATVAAAYLLNPDISKAFGYQGQKPARIDPTAPGDWVDLI